MAQFKWLLILLVSVYYQPKVAANSTITKNILNGHHANPKQFPYQVYVLKFENYEYGQYCAGVLISNRIILTAASCISDKVEFLKIYLAAVDISPGYEAGLQRIYVNRKNVVVHPEWDQKQNINDIALIKLPADLQFDEYIQPVQLPDPSQLYENENGIVSVWRQNTIQSHTANELMYGNATVISSEECKSFAQNYRPAIFYPSSWLCLKPTDVNICTSNYGSPVVKRNEDGSNILLGLASFIFDGSNTCSANRPTIFTRLTSYLEWIKKNE